MVKASAGVKNIYFIWGAPIRLRKSHTNQGRTTKLDRRKNTFGQSRFFEKKDKKEERV